MRLAEQYIDLSTLTTICEMKNDPDQLVAYLEKFSNSVKEIKSLN